MTTKRFSAQRTLILFGAVALMSAVGGAASGGDIIDLGGFLGMR